MLTNNAQPVLPDTEKLARINQEWNRDYRQDLQLLLKTLPETAPKCEDAALEALIAGSQRLNGTIMEPGFGEQWAGSPIRHSPETGNEIFVQIAPGAKIAIYRFRGRNICRIEGKAWTACEELEGSGFEILITNGAYAPDPDDRYHEAQYLFQERLNHFGERLTHTNYTAAGMDLAWTIDASNEAGAKKLLVGRMTSIEGQRFDISMFQSSDEEAAR